MDPTELYEIGLTPEMDAAVDNIVKRHLNRLNFRSEKQERDLPSYEQVVKDFYNGN